MGPAPRVLILGATGMLGRALMAEGRRRQSSVVGIARSGTDINIDICDANALTAVLAASRPNVVINSAAVTSIDACERDPGLAYTVNARAASLLANAAKRSGAYLVQISTDHYFSGDGARMHSENEPVTLLNEYARTKYAGERFALTNPDALVVRTNVVGFRGHPKNPTFVEWVFRSLEHRLPMTLFDDYFASSIDVRQFSSALFDLLPARPCGVLNVAARQVSSKKIFIEALAEGLGLRTAHCKIDSVHSMTGPKRAESVGLDVSKAENLLGRMLPDLQSVITGLVHESREKA